MLFLILAIICGWSEDTLIAEGYTSYPNQHNIVCDANEDVHAVWFKWEFGPIYSIWYQHYTGNQWINMEEMSESSGHTFASFPSIATSVDGSEIYVVWENGWGYCNILLRKFCQGNWEDTVIYISSDVEHTYAPCGACDSEGVFHIVWEKEYEIHYRNFRNSVLSDEILLSNSGVYAAYPSIATFGEKLFVVWEDLRDGNFEIYFKEFDGNKWSNDKRITNSTPASLFPSLSVDSTGIVHIVWQEDAIGGYKIFYTKNTQGNFDTPTVIVESPSEAVNSSIVSDGEKIHLVWSDSRDGDWEIYHKVKSQKLKVKSEWGESVRLTYSSGISANPSITADKDGNLYLLFWDTRDGKAKVYFKKKKLKNTRPQEHKSVNLVISPNPFTQKTVIRYTYPFSVSGHEPRTRITIHDIAGRLVKEFPINDSRFTVHEVIWDSKDTNGVELSSGIYFLKVVGATSSCDFSTVESQRDKIIEKIILIR